MLSKKKSDDEVEDLNLEVMEQSPEDAGHYLLTPSRVERSDSC
jgi:hypothetical protein